MSIILIIIASLAFFNIARIGCLLIIANINKAHTLKKAHGLNNRPKELDSPDKLPGISIIIPAFNEEKLIRQCVESVFLNTYLNKEVVVVNDGSTDSTSEILTALKTDFPDLVVINQENSGKSVAINNALEQTTRELVMVLDSDSKLAKNSVATACKYFAQDPKLIALCANVRIDKAKTIIEYAQKLEYSICFKFKEADPMLNFLFVIGGVGSTFRREKLTQAGKYDTDSITEDLDLTFKLLKTHGNKENHFGYAPDFIAYTPAVHNYKDLFKQRFRWKYGLFKTSLKYKSLFFSRKTKKYSRTLTWWKLPKVLFFEEISTLMEPIFFLLIGYLITAHMQINPLFPVVIIYMFLSLAAVFSDHGTKLKDKIKAVIISPLSFFLLYIVTVIELTSLCTCLYKSKEIVSNTSKIASWKHPTR